MKESLHCHVGEIVELHEKEVKSMFPQRILLMTFSLNCQNPKKLLKPAEQVKKFASDPTMTSSTWDNVGPSFCGLLKFHL